MGPVPSSRTSAGTCTHDIQYTRTHTQIKTTNPTHTKRTKTPAHLVLVDTRPSHLSEGHQCVSWSVITPSRFLGSSIPQTQLIPCILVWGKQQRDKQAVFLVKLPMQRERGSQHLLQAIGQATRLNKGNGQMETLGSSAGVSGPFPLPACWCWSCVFTISCCGRLCSSWASMLEPPLPEQGQK